jgi:hypothetical protein
VHAAATISVYLAAPGIPFLPDDEGVFPGMICGQPPADLMHAVRIRAGRTCTLAASWCKVA